ncbi:MAG: tRNA (N6-isopentenyl adenosine(37)-C2)-methylthiotransferase MiaB [Mogibacterium sp.]|nr:tRNA (N6-isopentenyl adenosine(37)-C2)-methylthiotransferase MiaB [Mogibacterium sp.]
MKKYHIITYGCQMNEHDSENIAGLLEAMGYEHCDDPYRSDITIINTCSVRENADKRFFGTLGQFKRVKKNDPDFILCVCGCMPQQPRIIDEINKRFSWVDIVFGTQNIADLPRLLEERIKTGRRVRSIIDNNASITEDEMRPVRMHRHKALVNITFGCNNFCTYCIVPYTRGREKSRMLKDICSEVERLANEGVIEIMLLGQNVDSYKDAAGHSFADLIRAVNAVDGIERIRFMTSHPKDISDEMIECFGCCDKLCHNIHLPVQSGSDRILKRMNRHYDRESYLKIVEKLRAKVPDITISTDIIVGFPGETEEDFEDTLDIVKRVKYDSAFTFIYSPREGTPAAAFPDQIPDEVCHERFDRLVEILNDISLKKNLEYRGKVYEVIAEGVSRSDDTVISGRTDGFKLVNFTSDRSPEELMGRKVSVRITESKTFSLEGVEETGF